MHGALLGEDPRSGRGDGWHGLQPREVPGGGRWTCDRGSTFLAGR